MCPRGPAGLIQITLAAGGLFFLVSKDLIRLFIDSHTFKIAIGDQFRFDEDFVENK